MKKITDPGVTRQVQPIDLSFLSEADTEVVAGVEAMIKSIYGITNRNPIIVRGLSYNTGDRMISAGVVIYNSTLYAVKEMRVVQQLSPGMTYIGDILGTVKLFFRQSVVAPSPVKNRSLVNAINCHYDYYGILTQNPHVNGEYFQFTDLNRIEPLATRSYADSLQSQINIINTRLSLRESSNITL